MKMRSLLVFVLAFVLCLFVGFAVSLVGALVCNLVAGGVQTRFPGVYKALMYASSLYGTFLVLTIITAMVRSVPSRGLPAILAYIAIAAHLFVNDMFLAMGMEIDSRPIYAVMMFAPVVVYVILGLWLGHTRRDASESPFATKSSLSPDG